MLAFTYDDKLFRKAKWENFSKIISWQDIYWNALKNNYFKYRVKYNNYTFRSSHSACTQSVDKNIDSLINRNCTNDNRIEMNKFIWYKRNSIFKYINLSINLKDLICVLASFNYSANFNEDCWKR